MKKKSQLTLHFHPTAAMVLTSPAGVVMTKNYLKIKDAEKVSWICKSKSGTQTRSISVSWQRKSPVVKTRGWNEDLERFMKGYPAMLFFFGDRKESA